MRWTLAAVVAALIAVVACGTGRDAPEPSRVAINQIATATPMSPTPTVTPASTAAPAPTQTAARIPPTPSPTVAPM